MDCPVGYNCEMSCETYCSGMQCNVTSGSNCQIFTVSSGNGNVFGCYGQGSCNISCEDCRNTPLYCLGEMNSCTVDCTSNNCQLASYGCQSDQGPCTCLGVGCNFPLAYCSDRIVQSWEQCDDGNNLGTDGCSPFCYLEVCTNIPVAVPLFPPNNTIFPLGTTSIDFKWEFFNESACNFCTQKITFDSIEGNSSSSIACDNAVTNHTSVQNPLPGYGSWLLQVCNASVCNSEVISFCVQALPSTPMLISPKNMATLVQQPTFIWTQSNFGSACNAQTGFSIIQISQNSNFATFQNATILEQQSNSNYTYTLSQHLQLGVWYWRIIATISSYETVSATGQFTLSNPISTSVTFSNDGNQLLIPLGKLFTFLFLLISYLV